MSKPVEDAAKGLDVLTESFGAVTKGLGLVVGAVAAATGAIVQLGQRGAGVNDVKDAFASLSSAAGESADVMLGELQRGTLDTISNFDLMTKANQVLGSGLVTSSKDMGTLAAGAKLLADRTGKDTSEAFDTLTDAMAKGRTATLKQLGVFVESKTALEQYAAAIGKTSGDLNDQERATALSQAALAALRQELELAGPPAADFGDLIDQGKTAVANFVDNLASAVAVSPVLTAGLAAIRDGVQRAFGGDQSALIQTIMGYVESFAIGLTYAAELAIEAARLITHTWNGLKVLFNFVMTGIFVSLALAGEATASLIEKAAQLPGIGGKFQGIASDARTMADQLAAVRDSFGDQTKEAVENALEQEAAFDRAKAGVAGVRDAMKGARDAQTELTTATEAGAAGVKRVGDAAVLSEAQLKALSTEMQTHADATRTHAEAVQLKFEELQARLTSANQTGIEGRLGEIEAARTRELEGLIGFVGTQTGMYALMSSAINGYYDSIAAKAREAFEAAAAASIQSFGTQQEQADAAYNRAKANYERLAVDATASFVQVALAYEAMEQAKEKLDEINTQAKIDRFTTLASSASSILRDMFGKSKAAAIAAAIIDTAAAVAKALSAYPWPFNLAPAAAAAAAGYAQVNAIRNTNAEGFAEGTPGTLFQDFGRETVARLHNQEAVVTVAQGQTLAGMIGDALAEAAGGGAGNAAVVQRLERIEGAVRNLAFEMAVAVRDQLQTRPSPA